MKSLRIRIILLALAAAVSAIAQSGDMKSMDMKAKDKTAQGESASEEAHQATGTVKKIDAKAGKVTLAHGPVKSLAWPPMTMIFVVSDKSQLDKLAVGKQVEFEFVKKGPDYVLTAVK